MAIEAGEWLVYPTVGSAYSPDTNHGSTAAWANPTYAIDGFGGTFAGSSAGGGIASPTYAPAMGVQVPETYVGAECVGVQMDYELIYVPEAGPGDPQASVMLIWQENGPSAVADRTIYPNRWTDLSGPSGGPGMVRTTRQFYWAKFEIQTPFELGGTTDEEPRPDGSVGYFHPNVTIVNRSGFSSGPVMGMKLYDLQFIMRDRHRYHSGSQTTV